MTESKATWLSKTMWMNMLVAIAAFLPPVQDYIGKHPETFVWVLTVANMILRFISKGKIVLRDE